MICLLSGELCCLLSDPSICAGRMDFFGFFEVLLDVFLVQTGGPGSRDLVASPSVCDVSDRFAMIFVGFGFM